MGNRAQKLITFAAGIGVGILLAFCIAVLIQGAGTVYATPQNESSFLRSYSPDPAMKAFESPRWIANVGEAQGNEAGYREAHFSKFFDVRFAMSSDERHSLMAALRDDVVAQFARSGAYSYDKTGNDTDGYRFRYVDGANQGTVVISPLRELDENHLGALNGSGPKKESLRFLQPGEIPIGLTITAEETRKK